MLPVLNFGAPFPIDHDPACDDLTAAILDEWGRPAVWKPQGRDPVPLRAYVRRARARLEPYGRGTAAVVERTSALMAAADVPGIAAGDVVEVGGDEYEIGEVIPDGSAFVRLLLRRPGL